MGMYTELVLGVELKREVPAGVVEEIQGMLGERELASEGRPPRWRYMLTMDSYYFDGDTRSTLRYDDISKSWFLTVRCNLKNYNDEIATFLDWIVPHADTEGFVGYMRYEEDDDPTLIYFSDGVVRLGDTTASGERDG